MKQEQSNYGESATIKKQPLTKEAKTKAISMLVIGISIIVLAYFLTLIISNVVNFYIQGHEFKWQSPVLFQAPLEIKTKSGKEVSLKVVQEVKADYKFCYDPISCIRDVGESLKVSNQDIMTMVRIAKCESGYREDASNVNSNGTFDRGIFEINSIHKDISNKDAFTFESNIRWAYKTFLAQGFTPWNSSKSCWNN